MQIVYLGRQPILDRESNLNSYEILYSEGSEPEEGFCDNHLSVSVINNILNKFMTKEILGDRKAFVKIDKFFLLSDLIFTIPTDFFIFSIIDIDIDEKIVERFSQLKNKGYELSINDIIFNEKNFKKYLQITSFLSYIKMNFNKKFENSNDIKKIIEVLKVNNIKVVATKIEDSDSYTAAKNLGCEFFQGYFFAKPKFFKNKGYDSSQAKILKLYTLLMENTNIDEIATEFEQNHAITIQLLQYINSGAFHFKNRISSIHHVLILVGRTPLAQWLMLIIYSKSASTSNQVSPLLLMVKHRTELMEAILKKVVPNVRSNTLGQAYFVGVLSLIDTVFSTKLEKILEDMNVDDIIKNALFKDAGILGEIYTLIRDIESFYTPGISKFIEKHNLSVNIIEELSIKSMQEVTTLENHICLK
ncbi:MAG: EAL domain-containing protein [Sulfurimonas sp.]|nr:EAL domain-containing protein [Sulfurimonas sp.]